MALLNLPFDDTQTTLKTRGIGSQSTNSDAFDSYRQGVELTQPRHFSRGIVKIHAGFHGQAGDHTIPTAVYGQSRTNVVDATYHVDTVPATTDSLVQDATSRGVVIDRGLNVGLTATNFDGVVEPLTIRNVVARQIVKRNVLRKVTATLLGGNIVDRTTSDRQGFVVKRADRSAGTRYMLDNVSGMGGIVTIPSTPSPDARVAGPFVDSYNSALGMIASTNAENDVSTSLNAMSPGTVNALPPDYEQPGAAGFYF